MEEIRTRFDKSSDNGILKLISKFQICFSAKYLFSGQYLSRRYYQPTYQLPEGVYLLDVTTTTNGNILPFIPIFTLTQQHFSQNLFYRFLASFSCPNQANGLYLQYIHLLRVFDKAILSYNYKSDLSILQLRPIPERKSKQYFTIWNRVQHSVETCSFDIPIHIYT